MSISFKSGLLEQASADPEVVAAHLRAYAERHRMLGAKRLLIFAVALVLQAFFVGEEYIAVSTILIVISEAFDSRTATQAGSLRADLPASIRAVLRRVHMGVLYSSLMISFFALSIAFSAAGGNSFIAMHYLLAAAVFAGMNTHQLSSALVIRLCVYGVAALTIPFSDVLPAEDLFGQQAWLTFLISLFAFYFIIDGSMIGLRYYRTNSRQLAQLRAENARSIKALDEKAQVLSILREEVRTSLASIHTSLDAAETLGPMPQDALQAFTTAQRDAARLTTQIDELLDFHEFEMNEMTFDFCDIQLARLIAGAVTDARSHAQPHGIALKMLPVDTDILLRADPMRLEQVITDLLANAVRLSDRGSEVTLQVTATPKEARISVCYKGGEMATANHTRAFETSGQLQTLKPRQMETQKPRLKVSKQIIEAHGGLLGFEPHETGGAVFHVQLNRVSPPPPHPINHPDAVRSQ